MLQRASNRPQHVTGAAKRCRILPARGVSTVRSILGPSPHAYIEIILDPSGWCGPWAENSCFDSLR